MLMKARRLQVLVEDDQYQRLEQAAGERGSSVATVVREAIDEALPASQRQRRAAADALLEAQPMTVPDKPSTLERELDELREGRFG
jgi:predicted DNA-binding protein